MRHELKTWPEFFDAVWSGSKKFEVRRDDRGFQVGDELELKRWQPDGALSGGYYTSLSGLRMGWGDGAEIVARITYKMPGGRFGLDPQWCILGIDVCEKVAGGNSGAEESPLATLREAQRRSGLEPAEPPRNDVGELRECVRRLAVGIESALCDSQDPDELRDVCRDIANRLAAPGQGGAT